MNQQTPPASSLPSSRDPITETFRVIQRVIIAAFLLATLYTAWSPTGLLSGTFEDQFPNLIAGEGTALPDVTRTPRMRRIGIVVGHWGNDSGAVCPDGLREVDLNHEIATRVQKYLADTGIQTDLLKEKDELLNGYQATALVSIHNDSCDYINDVAAGFKVAGRPFHDESSRLAACMNNRYHNATKMERHPGSITSDMTDYHAFDKLDPETPAVIIETGFMNLDRQMLVNHTDVVAKGVFEGIRCFINYESLTPVAPPTPQSSPESTLTQPPASPQP